MADDLTLLTRNIYKDAAKSFVFAELERIETILSQDYPDYIKDACKQLRVNLLAGVEKIKGQAELLHFNSLLDLVADLVDKFLTSTQTKSSWWAKSLIKDCYRRCGMGGDRREILIIHYLNSSREGFSVVPNLFAIPAVQDICRIDK